MPTLKLRHQLAHEWEPVENIGACTPTILFGAESHEQMPLSQQTEMAEAMRQRGCPVTLDVMRSGHAFAYAGEAFPALDAFIGGLE